MRSRLVVVVVLTCVVLGCGGPTSSPTPSAEVVAVIADGASPSTFLSAGKLPDCSYGAYIPDMWMAEYIDLGSPENGISQASMWDQPDTENPSLRQINVLVTVGSLLHHKNYEVIGGRPDDPPIEHSIVEAGGGAIFHAHFRSTVVAPTGDVPDVDVDVTFRCAVVEGR